MILKMAFRNLWRQKKRTFLTLITIFTGRLNSGLIHDEEIDKVVFSDELLKQYTQNNPVMLKKFFDIQLTKVISEHSALKVVYSLEDINSLSLYAQILSNATTRIILATKLVDKTPDQLENEEDLIKFRGFLKVLNDKSIVTAPLSTIESYANSDLTAVNEKLESLFNEFKGQVIGKKILERSAKTISIAAEKSILRARSEITREQAEREIKAQQISENRALTEEEKETVY